MVSRGERLRQALEARGIHKQMALANELGVDESAISRWQRDSGLSLAHAARLCEVLDISLDWLILGRGNMDLHRPPEIAANAASSIEPLESLPAPVFAAIRNLIRAILDELNKKSATSK